MLCFCLGHQYSEITYFFKLFKRECEKLFKRECNLPKTTRKLCFPQNFHTRKLCEITVFYAVYINWRIMIHQGKMKVNIPAGNYLLKVNNRNSRIYFTSCSNVFIVNFEEVIAGWNITFTTQKVFH